MQKKNEETFHTYQIVDEILIGTTVINLGIVKRRFYNPVNNSIKLTFNPCRFYQCSEVVIYFDCGIKLMTA